MCGGGGGGGGGIKSKETAGWRQCFVRPPLAAARFSGGVKSSKFAAVC